MEIDVMFSDIEDDPTLTCDFDKYTIHDGKYSYGAMCRLCYISL